MKILKGKEWNENFVSWGGYGNRGTAGSSLVCTLFSLILGSNRLSCIVPLPPLKVWFYRGEKTSSPCAVPVQCRSATEQAQRAGVGQVVCTIYWFINYLFFFLLSSILCDLRLFTFFILPPCTPFPNLFFSNVISSGSFFSCSFFFSHFWSKKYIGDALSLKRTLKHSVFKGLLGWCVFTSFFGEEDGVGPERLAGQTALASRAGAVPSKN